MQIDDKVYLKAAVELFETIKGKELIKPKAPQDVPAEVAKLVAAIAKSLKAELSVDSNSE